MNGKNSKLIVQEIEISMVTVDKEDYISLTNMVAAKDGEGSSESREFSG